MRLAAIWIGMLLGMAGPALAAEPDAAPPPPPAPAADQDLVIKTLPGIVIDTKVREVRLEGVVCLRSGLLELLACSQGTRDYESIIAIKAKPSHVTFALALLGLEPGKPGFLTEGGAFSPPAGEVLDIVARFGIEKKTDGTTTIETVEVPAWKLLRPAGAKEGFDRPMEWVYVGRPEAEALRAADHGGTVICLSNFTEAVIDVPFESTSINANLLFEANDRLVPPAGTPVELVIRPTGRHVEPTKVETEVVLKKDQPPLLDGKPTDLAALKDAVSAMPARIRTAVLRAEADVPFGRVMAVHNILRDALMQVHMVVLSPDETRKAEAETPKESPEK